MSMADMENKGGRRQHHQGSIQNTNGMSMICALGQGLVIFVIDAGMIDTVDIAETKVEGFALQWFTVQYCLSHTDIDTQTKWYQNTDSESIDPCRTPWCFPTMGTESRHWSINLPDNIRTVQQRLDWSSCGDKGSMMLDLLGVY
ncbi:unnamed protein product [Fusarium graminearum]|uniref:Chromosome 1, complete genome n=2 Tax=Gibberella zeae TaxID=5518 RepID=A0A098D2Q9_GIBZE|nr:unnamed protein product [Fusarium graminearum]CAF3592479.1 unnamed protein product [Fusarium graminearum]CAG1959737.1 unnamed protein product [Fusarium graminearum]CAG1964521.1 unnamed protein product [Fusarium graminearum]CEF73244.1 unnamed protein product [Fusarium graminearum]